MALNEVIKSKINRLFFDENKTIPQISKELNIPYSNVLSSVKRGDVFRHKSNKFTVKNNAYIINIILEEVGKFHNIDPQIIGMKSRLREIVVPRQTAHLIAHNLTKSSDTFIGKYIGNVNHATVIHSRGVMMDYLSYKNEVSEDYHKIEELCISKIKEYEAKFGSISKR